MWNLASIEKKIKMYVIWRRNTEETGNWRQQKRIEIEKKGLKQLLSAFLFISFYYRQFLKWMAFSMFNASYIWWHRDDWVLVWFGSRKCSIVEVAKRNDCQPFGKQIVKCRFSMLLNSIEKHNETTIPFDTQCVTLTHTAQMHIDRPAYRRTSIFRICKKD